MFGVGSSFILSSLSNLGLALYLVFKNNLFFFQIASALGRSCTEFSWAWAHRYSGTMTSTGTNTCSILWRWPMNCPCCSAGCGKFKCTGELAREKMQCSLLPSMPSLSVLVRESSSQSLKKQLWFIACF